jgi:hypothetical protein
VPAGIPLHASLLAAAPPCAPSNPAWGHLHGPPASLPTPARPKRASPRCHRLRSMETPALPDCVLPPFSTIHHPPGLFHHGGLSPAVCGLPLSILPSAVCGRQSPCVLRSAVFHRPSSNVHRPICGLSSVHRLPSIVQPTVRIRLFVPPFVDGLQPRRAGKPVLQRSAARRLRSVIRPSSHPRSAVCGLRSKKSTASRGLPVTVP